MAVIGIDLGTTNSMVAQWTEDGAMPIKNALGEVLTPSVVGLDDDGNMLVGAAAKERLIAHPDKTIASFKRWMGSSREVRLGKNRLRAEDLSALVLKMLASDVETALGQQIEEAVISVPAYFNDNQRKATLDAAHLAGLPCERLINEPTAAALSYGLQDVEEGSFLVFDLGGGTFDVSVLERYDDVFEVRSTAGDTFLGGNDFTEMTAGLLSDLGHFSREDLAPSDVNRLFREAERIKQDLTIERSSAFKLAFSDGNIVEGTLTRDALEEACSGLLKRLRKPLERAIADTNMRPSDIDAIVMVGGATRMPMVRDMVTRLFGRFPNVGVDPDRTIGLGAAVQAGLKARDAALEDMVMTDVCPFTLGTGILRPMPNGQHSYVMSPLIERNSIVPVSRNGIYHTIENNQTAIHLEIFQGESMRPENNVRLGALDLKVPRNKAGEEEVDLRFTYDINGALEVEAKVLSTGKVERVIIRNQSGLSEDELEKRFAELAHIKIAPRDQAENRVLLARAERLYEESRGGKREAIAQMIAWFEAAIDDPANRTLEDARAEFAQTMDRFEFSVFEDE